MSETRCESCGSPVEILQIDDTEETVMVSGKAIYVAIRVPDCQGVTTTFARKVHRCRNYTRRPR
ncbi:MAG TPA: hypothetical protein VFQ42_22130 [Mycobacterium sp.]|nr:hypothetical protein [Mycobacterium sp.]